MNYQVDIVVIGDSKNGNEIVKNIASVNPTIKVAFISREFKSTTTHDFLNVEYVKEEVTFTDYKNRLFGCYLKNGDRIYCTHLVIASGLAYQPLLLNNKQVPCVYNNTEDIPKIAKSQPAIVIGNDNSDVKFALAVAKKYKQVYFCTKDLTLKNVTAANVKKLAEVENLVVLPNTSIINVVTENDILQKVELDNYSTINCSAIYVKTDSTPDINFVSDKLIQKDELGYLVVNKNAESMLVPKCFAIGTCTVKSTKKMGQLLVDTILSDF
jgi:thioredoxin reductase